MSEANQGGSRHLRYHSLVRLLATQSSWQWKRQEKCSGQWAQTGTDAEKHSHFIVLFGHSKQQPKHTEISHVSLQPYRNFRNFTTLQGATEMSTGEEAQCKRQSVYSCWQGGKNRRHYFPLTAIKSADVTDVSIVIA